MQSNLGRSAIPFTLCLLLSATAGLGRPPVMRVLKPAQSGASLLKNGGFEVTGNRTANDWAAAPDGYTAAPSEGRGGSIALFCENTNARQWVGASQTLALNRTKAAPLTVRGWSKAEAITGAPDSGYSLYVDIIYQDGTPLWGQTANFRTGTHDWQQRELLIIPEKPVKSVTLHCILRGHAGKAWFDDVSLEEVKPDGEAVIFEGVPVVVRSAQPAPGEPAATPLELSTRDGLELTTDYGVVRSLRVNRKELAGNAPSGFLVRDVAKGSDIYDFSRGECAELGLKLETTFQAESNHIVITGRISDTSGKDRAVTLFFALPIDAAGWHWGDDIRRKQLIQGRAELANTVSIGCGATGTLSLYPFAAIFGPTEGLALGLDMAQAAQYRLVYHGGTKQFFIAYDFGLVPESRRFLSSADFRFVLFRFDPGWGFRAAARKFAEIFPDYFQVRSADQGIWMPFTDVSRVQDWQDFGFKYHEGNNNVPWDDEHRILSFRYTEPMTWWMAMKKDTPRTLAEATRVRDALATDSKDHDSRMAKVSQVAAMLNDSGEPALTFRDTPWCNGAVWSLNPNSSLPISSAAGEESVERRTGYNAATIYWNETIKQDLYGAAAKGHLDGEYLDSIEGYVTTDLNFCREHFQYTTVPLTFSSDTRQPAIYKGLAVYEFTRWLSENVHRLGKLMFANGVPYRFSFLCPWLDVLGTETDWLQGGKYRPASDSQMCLWRTMSGGKPFLLLMNTDYDAFTPALVERYFQRSLFYGMFPSMFSHNAAENPYWQNPNWYNRDRQLFKKYLPIIKKVAEAGWQPVTLTSCDNQQIYVERFGPGSLGYLTLLNETDQRQAGTLSVDWRKLKFREPPKARDLLSGSLVERADTFKIELQAGQATVLGFE